MNSIFISVIICCYNSEKYIIETLKSVINQTYNKYEIIIVDDGSQDNTSKLINKFILDNLKIKIKIISQKNSGLPTARNKAIANAKYDFIAILDHDDLWDSNKLYEQVKQINENKNCVLFFSDFKYLNFKSTMTSRFQTAKEKDNYDPSYLNLNKERGFIHLSLLGCFIGSSTVIFNKNILNDIGNFNTDYKFLADYIFFLDVSRKFDIYCSKLKLSSWRYHDDNATIKLNKKYIKEMNILFIHLLKDKAFSKYQKLKILLKFCKFNIKNYIFDGK
jgi:glycosyltransferase involved in cell wall biosynthesis